MKLIITSAVMNANRKRNMFRSTDLYLFNHPLIVDLVRNLFLKCLFCWIHLIRRELLKITRIAWNIQRGKYESLRNPDDSHCHTNISSRQTFWVCQLAGLLDTTILSHTQLVDSCLENKCFVFVCKDMNLGISSRTPVSWYYISFLEWN